MAYFDNAATTRPRPSAIDAARRVMEETWGNPSSAHKMGFAAEGGVTEARLAVARGLSCRRGGQVFFTAGGTEADVTALTGVIHAKNRPDRGGSRGKILITDSEHAAVENTARLLEAEGFTVLRVPTRGGVLDLSFIEQNAEGALLASFMLVNNETGALYDVATAFALVKSLAPGAVTHTDAVQAFLKVPFSPSSLMADMVSVSAHKVGGLKGTGALYVADGILTAKKLRPLLPGGGQEGGMRSGTENVPGIAAFGAAVAEALAHREEEAARVESVRAVLTEGLSALEGISLLKPARGTKEILSFSLPGIRSETVLTFLSERGIYVSAGSACDVKSRKAGNRVLSAFGLTDREAETTLRVSLSPDNTAEEAEKLLSTLGEALSTLQRMK